MRKIDKWSKAALEQESSSPANAITTTTGTAGTTVTASRKPSAVDGAFVAASTTLLLPSTIPEGSKESLATPTLEQSIKKKTSGYLEKMSKAIIMSSGRTGGGVVETESGTTTIATALEKGDAAAAAIPVVGEGETEFCVKKLPRVFYPLD